MAKAKTDLVIVESPATARTIEKYLGNHYQVVASMATCVICPRAPWAWTSTAILRRSTCP